MEHLLPNKHKNGLGTREGRCGRRNVGGKAGWWGGELNRPSCAPQLFMPANQGDDDAYKVVWELRGSPC